MKNYKTTIILFLILSLLGCSKSEKDTLAPFINISSPKNHDNFNKGNIITYEIEFNDDFKLKNYKINIHSASIPVLKQTNNIWDTTIINSIDGLSAIIKTSLNIPTTIDTGNYLFIVTCSDKTGNEDWVARDFKVQ